MNTIDKKIQEQEKQKVKQNSVDVYSFTKNVENMILRFETA